MNRRWVYLPVLTLLGGCFFGGDGEIVDTCEDPQPYQFEREGKKIDVPEDLDSLDSFREMPIPRSEAPPRPDNARCLTAPPSVIAD